MTTVKIGPHLVGAGEQPFVVAEMSGNHNGDLGRALAIVDAVAASGAHALKLQTYRPDTITIDVDTPAFRISGGHELWGGQNLYRLYERAHTPYDWHGPIFERARERGLTVFSSPFDPSAVELLEGLDVPAYKIASSELVDLPLIRLVAGTGKPLVISTGMATLAEIDAAVRTARDGGAGGIVLLACTAAYPAPPADSNLRRIPVLADAFGVPVGLSDHTPGIGVPVASVAL
ncbi:N-acetylneuraminate synthase family protein, partial [Micromonospora humida]